MALARIKVGITQEQLAPQLGVSQVCVSQIERRTNITNKMWGMLIFKESKVS